MLKFAIKRDFPKPPLLKFAMHRNFTSPPVPLAPTEMMLKKTKQFE
jgi:hypothetical protein